MTGKRNGVAFRLRAGNKTFLTVHWHVAMVMTRFPTSSKWRKFYSRCGRSLATLLRKVLLMQNRPS